MTLHYNSTTSHYTAPHYTPFHCTALQCTAIHYIDLHRCTDIENDGIKSTFPVCRLPHNIELHEDVQVERPEALEHINEVSPVPDEARRFVLELWSLSWFEMVFRWQCNCNSHFVLGFSSGMEEGKGVQWQFTVIFVPEPPMRPTTGCCP